MMNSVTLPIVGHMCSPFREKFGIPRQPNLVNIESYIEMVEPYNDLLAFEESNNLVIFGSSGSFMTIKIRRLRLNSGLKFAHHV